MKNSYLEQVLKQRLIPQPKEIVFQEGECLIQDGISVELKTAENEEEFGDTVAELFSEYWNVVPEIKLTHSKAAEDFLEDQYEVQVTRKKITLISHCSKGLQLAMKTLRQLAEPIRGTASLEGFVLQTCKIQDYADSEFRAVRLDINPYNDLGDVEKKIRIAGALKFNYIFLDCSEVFPFKSHPAFAFKDHVKRPAFFRTLLDVADDVGITLIPCFNIFHQASFCEYDTEEHKVLNFHPEYAPLFEPGGWSWCMSNPESQAVVAGLVHELYEFFECPDYFHIGKISSQEFRFCRSCAEKSAEDLLSGQIAALYLSFDENRPRFVLGKEPSDPDKKVKIAFPGDILLEVNDGDKIPDGIDSIQYIQNGESVLADEAGGTVFDLNDELLPISAADIAWNGKGQDNYSTDAFVQVKLNAVADMEPVSHHDF